MKDRDPIATGNRPSCRKAPRLSVFWTGPVLLGVGLLLAAGCRTEPRRSESAPAAATHAREPAPDAEGGAAPGLPVDVRTPTHTEMRNVDLRIAEGAVLHVRRLDGEAVSSRKDQPIGLDDPASYELRLRSAETLIEYADLSRVLNDFTFNFDGAPVKALEVRREEDEGEEDEIQLTGRLRKVLGVPFEIEGRPEATADGKIRIRTRSIQAFDVKVGGLMDVLGLETGDVLGGLEERGLSVDGEDLILEPGRAFPPPRVSGRVTGVRVGPAGLTLRFGPAAARPPSQPSQRSNYVWFRRGTIRIGRMTQLDADLRIVDEDPHDPLDLDVGHMNEQLAAGYAKLASNGALTMFVPDRADIH